jgi:peptide/nickel transport system permease protein
VLFYFWLFGFVLQVHSFKYDGSLYEVDDFGEATFNGKHHLPAVVLGIRPLAVVIQLMRNSLLETSVRIISVLHVPKGYLNFKSFML